LFSVEFHSFLKPDTLKNPILLKTALLLLILIPACEEKEAACSCSDFIDQGVLTDTPVLGFHKLYLADETGLFFNEIYGDSLSFPVDSTLEEVSNLESPNELFQLFMLNLNANNIYQHSPKLGYAQAKDTARINKILSFHLEKDWMKVEKVKFIWGLHNYPLTDKETPYFSLYGLKEDKHGDPVVSSKYVESAEKYNDHYNNELSISISMNEEGTKAWAQMTSKNVGNFIAITAENKVLSAPVINGPITGGNAMITGGLPKEKTQELVGLINCEAYKRKIGEDAFEKEMAGCFE
tara:strand:- start:41 stop:922 length:882 start_codon:yes stop_codon:yes gene_type:complete